MKARDLIVGEEYAYSTSPDWRRFRWGEVPKHVRVDAVYTGGQLDLTVLDGDRTRRMGEREAQSRFIVAAWAEAESEIASHKARMQRSQEKHTHAQQVALRFRQLLERERGGENPDRHGRVNVNAEDLEWLLDQADAAELQP